MILPEFFAFGVGGQSFVLSESIDPASGETLKRAPDPKFLSHAKLMEAFPAIVDWEEAADQAAAAMVKRKYIRPGPEFGWYAVYLAQIDEAAYAMCRYGDEGRLAFLLLDRHLRKEQYRTGCSWDVAFRLVPFIEAMGKLQKPAPLPAPSPRGGAPARGGGAGSGWTPSPRQHCWEFAKSGTCKHGDGCDFVATHKCLRCDAPNHGWKSCPQGGSRS
jgi:hypothetical protein